MSEAARIERARLRQLVFLYVATCVRRGQLRDLRPLSLRPDQMRRIAELRTNELVALGELSGPSIQFDIDPDALDEVFLSLEEKQSRDSLIERCLQRDAPRAMMESYFGISRHRYTKLKSERGIPERRGRSPQPSETIRDEMHRLWECSRTPRNAATLLDIADRLEIPLRIVWDQLAKRLR